MNKKVILPKYIFKYCPLSGWDELLKHQYLYNSSNTIEEDLFWQDRFENKKKLSTIILNHWGNNLLKQIEKTSKQNNITYCFDFKDYYQITSLFRLRWYYSQFNIIGKNIFDASKWMRDIEFNFNTNINWTPQQIGECEWRKIKIINPNHFTKVVFDEVLNFKCKKLEEVDIDSGDCDLTFVGTQLNNLKKITCDGKISKIRLFDCFFPKLKEINLSNLEIFWPQKISIRQKAKKIKKSWSQILINLNKNCKIGFVTNKNINKFVVAKEIVPCENNDKIQINYFDFMKAIENYKRKKKIKTESIDTGYDETIKIYSIYW